jgi:hypothetical protein
MSGIEVTLTFRARTHVLGRCSASYYVSAPGKTDSPQPAGLYCRRINTENHEFERQQMRVGAS